MRQINTDLIAQGCNTYSKRHDQFVDNLPSHVLRGTGERVFGCDKKWYTDYVCGLGSNLISCHNNYSVPCEDEIELAEKLNDKLPFMEQMKFLKTGSEACQAAVRIARASVEGIGLGTGYHGWHNWCIAQEMPGAGCIDENYKKVDSIDDLICLVGPDTSYVIIEPVQLDCSFAHIKKLEKLRDKCTKYGTVLIFDEVITGFRFLDYCVANHYDITPDLICLGKALGYGYPISVVGGKKELMSNKDYFVSSTFAGDALAIRSAISTMNYLERHPISKLWERGRWFQDEFNKLTPSLKLKGYPTRAVWDGENIFKFIFWQEMAKEGYLLGKAWFITFSHTRKVLEKTLEDSNRIIDKISSGVCGLEGREPTEVFKR